MLRHETTESGRAVAADAEPHVPLHAVVDADAAVRRLVAREQSALRAALPRQSCQDELDVLAGAEGVRLEVGAGTEVPVRFRAADDHAVNTAVLGIGEPELGEDGMLPDVLDAKGLLSAELPAKLSLPYLQRHVRRLVKP